MLDREQPARERHLSADPVDVTPARRPERSPLVGRYARLEPVDPARHFDDLWPAVGDPADDASWDYLFNGPWRDADLFRAQMDAWNASEDPLFFAFVDAATGRAVGSGAFMRIEPGMRCIEIGHLWFSPAMRRSRIATEAIYLMMRHVFDDLGYRRLEWKCNAHNAPSRRAAVRFGFTFEGIFYRHMIVKGKNRDTAWYSLLAEEGPAVKAAYERWLDPTNFDDAGNQRERLADLTRR
jgi:RimJ/RimL family protein N-acetyltransferase